MNKSVVEHNFGRNYVRQSRFQYTHTHTYLSLSLSIYIYIYIYIYILNRGIIYSYPMVHMY